MPRPDDVTRRRADERDAAHRGQHRRERHGPGRPHLPVPARHRAWASWPPGGAGPTSMESLDEWGLGGREFGTWITWFLLGGDLYTAYTFVAVPAAMFALGAVAGFFAVPYTIVLYPIIFIFMPRLWSVCHRHGYVTPADFVRGRYGSRGAVAGGRGHRHPRDDALHRAAAGRHPGRARGGRRRRRRPTSSPRTCRCSSRSRVLAAYTYSSGLRAPALIAFVKDILIYLVIIVAVIYLPVEVRRLGRRSSTRPRTKMADAQPGHRQADRRRSSRTAGSTGPTPPGARLGAGAVHVPALDHGDAVVARAATRSAATPRSCRRTPSCSACSPCSAGSRSRPAPSRSGSTASPTRSWSSRSCSRTSFPSLVRRRRLRGHRDRRARAGGDHVDRGGQHFHPQHLQGVASSPTPPTQQEAKVGKLVSLVVKVVRAGLRARRSTSRTRSTSSSSAASGSCRRSRRSCSASTPAGSTAGRCSPAGRSAWSTAPSPPTTWSTRRRATTSAARWRSIPVDRPAGLHRADRVRHQPHRRGVLTFVLQRDEGRRRRRRDHHGRLLRRRG